MKNNQVMKAKSSQKLKIRQIADFKKTVKSTRFWETDPITATTLTVTHMTVFSK